MNRLRNPYWLIIFGPLLAFLALIALSVDPDLISIPGRLAIFGVFAFVGVRYVGRAPVLAWEGNFTPAARNIVGWGMVISALEMQQIYGALYLAWDRPAWLNSYYWSPSFTILMLVGASLVLSSVPKFWPLGPHSSGFGTAASFFFAVLGALTLFLAERLPSIWPVLSKALGAFVVALSHAV